MNYAPPPNKRRYFELIWAQAREVPYGRVATYGQLAALVPRPDDVTDDDYKLFASRWAGLALAACPDDVPWHRVVNAKGRISHPEAAKQQQRLEAEGVVLSNGKISLHDHRWPGQGEAPAQGQLFG